MARHIFFLDLLIDFIDLDVPLFPYESPYTFLKRKRSRALARRQYQESIWKLQRRGFLKIVERNGERFIKLTKKGQLETLLHKSKIENTEKWDGKWRLLMYDIPESSKLERNRFRILLKKNNFAKLQASVFISPYPLNQEAIEYLREIGLMDFIRIVRVDKMDNDEGLRKKFNLV